jgi:hypothetical protein
LKESNMKVNFSFENTQLLVHVLQCFSLVKCQHASSSSWSISKSSSSYPWISLKKKNQKWNLFPKKTFMWTHNYSTEPYWLRNSSKMIEIKKNYKASTLKIIYCMQEYLFFFWTSTFDISVNSFIHFMSMTNNSIEWSKVYNRNKQKALNFYTEIKKVFKIKVDDTSKKI